MPCLPVGTQCPRQDARLGGSDVSVNLQRAGPTRCVWAHHPPQAPADLTGPCAMIQSRWMVLSAEIKRSMLMPDYLTPAQLAAYEWLVPLLERPGVASFHGPSGAGKTFTAWVASRSAGARYLSTPNGLSGLKPDETQTVVIDNAPVKEDALRRLLSRCDLYRIQSVVFISAAPNPLRYLTHRLAAPTRTELEGVARRWMQRGYYNHQPIPDELSFWALLRAFSANPTANEE